MDGAKAEDVLKQFMADKQANDGTAPPSKSSGRKKNRHTFSDRPKGSPKPAQRGGQVPVPTEFGSNETRDDQMLRTAFNLRDDVGQVEYILDNPSAAGPATIFTVDTNDQTHLFVAVFKRRSHVTNLLLARGADVNKVDNALCTPINFAAYSGFAEGVRVLIGAGADLSRRDRLGNTPLHDIAASGMFMSSRVQQGEKAEEFGGALLIPQRSSFRYFFKNISGVFLT